MQIRLTKLQRCGLNWTFSSESMAALIPTFYELCRSAILKIGQRIPLAFRYAKMLSNLVSKRCGDSVEDAVQLSFPRSEFDIEKFLQQSHNCDLHESLGLQAVAGSFMAIS
jgi:hypothetical protein